MPPPDNHAVKSERARQCGLFTAGVNAGLDLQGRALPWWVQELYGHLGAHERGLLLGVLLHELEQMDDGE